MFDKIVNCFILSQSYILILNTRLCSRVSCFEGSWYFFLEFKWVTIDQSSELTIMKFCIDGRPWKCMFCVLSSDSRHKYMNSNKNRNDFCRSFFPHLNRNKLNIQIELMPLLLLLWTLLTIIMKRSAFKIDFNENEKKVHLTSLLSTDYIINVYHLMQLCHFG